MNIKNKNGSISAYGFACGHVEARDNGISYKLAESKNAELYFEHGAYHIRAFNYNLYTSVIQEWNTNGFRIWYSTESLSEARKIFKQECRKLGL